MAKAADEKIGTPRVWVKETFTEAFPVDLIAPAVGELLAKGFISLKNLERLQTQLASMRPKKKAKK